MESTSNYCVIDTETTGLEGDVVEIAAVAADGRFTHTLVKPNCPIDFQGMAAHHITEAMVQDAWPRERAIATIRRVMEMLLPDQILVAHNATFDRKFLPELSVNRWICTWRCALHLWPDSPGHGNQILRYWLGLNVDDMPAEAGRTPHRALYDAWVTRRLLQRMLAEVEMEFDLVGQDACLEKLIELTTAPVVLKKIRFGKHAGTEFEKIDSGYLRWILRQSDMEEDVRHTAQHWLDVRKRA